MLALPLEMGLTNELARRPFWFRFIFRWRNDGNLRALVGSRDSRRGYCRNPARCHQRLKRSQKKLTAARRWLFAGPHNVAVQALGRSAAFLRREGQVGCNRGLCGLWLEKTGIARLIANRMTERSRAAVSPKAEYIILS